MSVTVIVQFAVTKPRGQFLESGPRNAVCFADISGVLIQFHPVRLPHSSPQFGNCNCFRERLDLAQATQTSVPYHIYKFQAAGMHEYANNLA
jgi:hypothetical protein